MEQLNSEERVLAYSLATEIGNDELNHVAGGIGKSAGTRIQTSQTTAGGQDHTYDSDGD